MTTVYNSSLINASYLKEKKNPQLPLSLELKNSLESINSPCFHFVDEELKPQRKEESHLRPFLLTLHPALLHLFHCGADPVCLRAFRRHGECRADVPCLSCEAADYMRMADARPLPSLERMWSGVVGRAVCLRGSGQI